MVKRLAEVFAEIAKLPAEEQEAIAAFLADELSERRWAEDFKKPEQELVADYLMEFATGTTDRFKTDAT